MNMLSNNAVNLDDLHVVLGATGSTGGLIVKELKSRRLKTIQRIY